MNADLAIEKQCSGSEMVAAGSESLALEGLGFCSLQGHKLRASTCATNRQGSSGLLNCWSVILRYCGHPWIPGHCLACFVSINQD